jgi:hypothetical protein
VARPFAPAGPAAFPALSAPAGPDARHGHDFARVSVSGRAAAPAPSSEAARVDAPASAPSASGGAPVQRVNAPKKKKAPKAKDRMRRWQKRSAARKARGRLGTGRYDTPTGPVTVSGLFGQLMTQTRKADYGNKSLGSVPDYSTVRAHLPDSALSAALFGGKPPGTLSHHQRLAASIASALTNVSEEDREPGYGKFARALGRKRLADRTAAHPFDPAVNPAVVKGGAAKMRDLLSGNVPLNKAQRDAVDGYASDSSNEGKPNYAIRRRIIKIQK